MTRSFTDDVHALEEAWVAFHLAYAQTSFSQIHEDEDCLWYESTIGFLVFGGVVRPRLASATADRRIEELLQTLRGQPHHWLVTPTSEPTDLTERVLRAGGEKIGELSGMVMELSQLAPAPTLPTGIEIRPATTDEAVRDYARVYAHLFEVPMEGWVNNLADAEVEIFHSGHDPFHRYLAYENGRAIAAGMTCLDNGRASIETLSTLPDYRNRGIGAVLATQALQYESENGARMAVVWSSPGARHVYHRMGFRHVCVGNLLV